MEQPATTPKDTQADYPLSLSLDGHLLVLQRLDYFDFGSLYLLHLEDGHLVKVNPGFYGNYYPDGVSIYWTGR